MNGIVSCGPRRGAQVSRCTGQGNPLLLRGLPVLSYVLCVVAHV